MIIVLAHCGNGYPGCNSEDAFFFEDGVLDKEIDEEVHFWACDIADAYSYVHFGWGEKYSDEDWEDYIENHVTFDWYVATYEEYLNWCEYWDYEPIISMED